MTIQQIAAEYLEAAKENRRCGCIENALRYWRAYKSLVQAP